MYLPVVPAAGAAAVDITGRLDGLDDYGDDVDPRKSGGGGAGGGISLSGGAGGSGVGAGDLHLENARLRADLAAHVALLATIDPQRVTGVDGISLDGSSISGPALDSSRQLGTSQPIRSSGGSAPVKDEAAAAGATAVRSLSSSGAITAVSPGPTYSTGKPLNPEP
jgi:hypothetical protein